MHLPRHRSLVLLYEDSDLAALAVLTCNANPPPLVLRKSYGSVATVSDSVSFRLCFSSFQNTYTSMSAQSDTKIVPRDRAAPPDCLCVPPAILTPPYRTLADIV